VKEPIGFVLLAVVVLIVVGMVVRDDRRCASMHGVVTVGGACVFGGRR